MESWINLLMVCVLCIDSTAADKTRTCLPDSSSKGKHFMVGVFRSYENANSIQLILAADDDAHVRITAPFLNYDRHFIFSKHLTVEIGVTITQIKNDTEFKGFELESDKLMSVVVLSGYADFLEGYLALPITPVSTEYVVASYQPYEHSNRYFSCFFIVGVYPDTFVDIELPTSYKANPAMSGYARIELQPFESYLFQGVADLTGTIVRSTKPVSVISGSSYAQIPAKTGGAQFIVEQMVPTAFWDFTYIVPPIYPRSQHLIRIFAKENNTEIAIYNGTSHEKRYLNSLKYTEFVNDRKPVFIFADKPINVVQYGYDSDANAGDPFMSNAQAVAQQYSRYEFNTQPYYTANTLAVSVKTVDLPGLKLDGKKDAIQSAPKIGVVSPVENYTTLFLTLATNTFHVIEHERNQVFGAVVYGLQDVNTAYGYPLQLRLRDTSCQKNDTGTSGNSQNLVPAQCFSCEDMTSLKYCDKVTTCSDPNKICYVQRYQKSAGVDRYRSGCKAERNCNVSLPWECSYCCKGNFCNNFGCGDNGVQSIKNRGPLCFDCAHHGEHEACQTIQLCSSGQVCKVEKYRWGDIDKHYVKGCADSRTCSTRRRSIFGAADQDSIPHTRSVPVCFSCCTEDFCNQNCTASGPAIIG